MYGEYDKEKIKRLVKMEEWAEAEKLLRDHMQKMRDVLNIKENYTETVIGTQRAYETLERFLRDVGILSVDAPFKKKDSFK